MKKIFYILVLLIVPFYGFADKITEQKIQEKLNNKTINDPYDRWKSVFDSIRFFIPSDMSYEEEVAIHTDILLNFVEKEIKNNSQRNRAKASVLRRTGYVYRDRGENPEQADAFFLKAIEAAEQSKNDTIIAFFYEDYAQKQSQYGSIQVAHDYIYKAIKLYESIGQYDKVSFCLYRIAINLLQTRDIDGLYRVVEQMKQNIEKESSVTALYTLYAIQGACYVLLDEQSTENTVYNDSALWIYENLIHLIENHGDELPKIAVVSWDYYNMALIYKKSNPNNYDSVSYFLNKAIEAKSHDENVNFELEIGVYIFYAGEHFEQNNYAQAEKDMLYVLSLLEQVKDNNSVVAEFSTAYKFLSKCYEAMNRLSEALKYQKLLTENEAKRYSNDKITAMDDMLVKYETEKKEEKIVRLAEQNRIAIKILILTGCLAVALLVAILFFIRFYRLKKKSLEQSIYESMLFSELKQNELEQNLKAKECLQQQYNDLELLSEHNVQLAQTYSEELQHIKQQLAQKPSKMMVEKLTEWISNSIIEKKKKHTYINKLSELDIDMLEQVYLTANEKISNMDMKYIICFAIDMDVKDMSLLFNIEPSSIYIVRYRIKKKFSGKNTLKLLI